MKALIKCIKHLQYLSPWRRSFFHRYEYFFTPRDLWFLCENLEAVASLTGSIVEIGCAHGATAVYLNIHLNYLLDRKILATEKKYFCVDTFSGFVASDVEFEVSSRRKVTDAYSKFRVNDVRWLNRVFASHGIERAKGIIGDANTFPFGQLGPFCFALLDVDLYKPIASALPVLYDNLTPGGTIIVDDCKANNEWDGALQAYDEFVAARGLPNNIQLGKFGVIRKPAA